MARHDALTGLANRVLLNERLEHVLSRVSRGEVVAVHLLDLDRFKAVNDTLGHPMGDKLLRLVADRLRPLVRETDIIARMGGDEFAIVQVALGAPGDATSLARRLIERGVRIVQATLLHQLGIDHEHLTYRYQGRDFRLTDVHGQIVREILQ